MSHHKKSSKKAERKRMTGNRNEKVTTCTVLCRGLGGPNPVQCDLAMHSPWNILCKVLSVRPDPADPAVSTLPAVPINTKESYRTQKPNPTRKHVRLHYSKRGKNTCPNRAQALWKNLGYCHSLTVFILCAAKEN